MRRDETRKRESQVYCVRLDANGSYFIFNYSYDISLLHSNEISVILKQS